MTYVDILAKFLEMFPNYQETITQYAPGEHNCITIKLRDGQELDFTYQDDMDWTLANRSKRAKFWRFK